MATRQLLDTVSKTALRLGAVLGVGGVVYNHVLYNVDAGHRAIIFDQLQNGIQSGVHGEGTHFLIPAIQYPIIFDVRSQPRSVTAQTPTKDLQTINITLRVLHRPKHDSLPWLYQNYGNDYQERILPSIVNEVLKAVIAQYNAGELITQREIVSQQIRENLNKRAKAFNILLDDISITHLTFGREFTSAVELKQVAQQEAERARFLVEQAEQEKLANVIRAEGDSQAAQLISDALKSSGRGLIELRKIEAAKEIAHNLSKSRNVAYLPAGKGMLLNMSV